MNKLTDRVAHLFTRAEKLQRRELSSSVIEHDKFDDGVLSDMVDRALHFRTKMYDVPQIDLDNMTDDDGNPIEVDEETREQAAGYIAWEDLFSDTFRALHTLDGPHMKPREDIKPSRELNHRIQQQLAYTDDFQKLRAQTRHDDIASAFAAIHLADGLKESLEEELQEFVLRAKEMDDIEQELEDMPPGDGQQPGAQPDPNGPPGPGVSALPPETPDPNAQKAQDLANKLDQLAQQQQDAGLGNNVLDKLNEAAQDANDAAQAISALPGTEQGDQKQLTPDQMIDLADKWRSNPEMKEIAMMVGRMQRDLRYRRTNRIIGGREEIVDVKLGDDLPLLLPHEKVKLMDETYELDFMRRFYEHDLLQYETQGYAEAGRGPIIVCVDGSGSMAGAENVWARAVALSLVSIAKREKRDAAVIEFSRDTKRWDFLTKQPTDLTEVIDCASHFFGGGTDITLAVADAKEMIDTVPEFKTADIVIATDGADTLGEDDTELRDELVARGVRLHGVAIGMESNDWLEEMCESVVSAWDLAGSNEATTHLAEAIS